MLLIDSAYPGELDTVKTALYNEGLDINNLSHILLTHKGFDNLGFTRDLLKIFPNVKVMATSNDSKFSTYIKLSDNDFVPEFENIKKLENTNLYLLASILFM